MARRPGGVTLVAVIVWINGLLEVIGGAIILFALGSASATVQVDGIAGGRTAIITYAILAILLGIITIVIGTGLLQGSRVARVLVTIALVLSLIGAILGTISLPGQAVGPLVTGFLALIGLILLWTGRASDFFRNS
jgi:hypothetical protein